jgi:hypothetical protein
MMELLNTINSLSKEELFHCDIKILEHFMFMKLHVESEKILIFCQIEDDEGIARVALLLERDLSRIR